MTNKSLVFISGFMGAGKSTHGKQLAKELGYHFIDLDSYIETKYDKSIVDVFQELGEEEFRKLETMTLTDCIENNIKTVIALGGGTPCFNNNAELLLKNGLLIYLKMEPKILYTRLEKAKFTRPLLEGKQKQELENYITDLLNQRELFYKQAQLIVDGSNIDMNELKKMVLEKI